MFQNVAHNPKAVSGPATVYFLNWLEDRVLTAEASKRAEQLFEYLVTQASPLGRLKTTPQTPPYHAEGDFVADHVKRIFMGLDAFTRGESLAGVEEFVRERDYLLEFHALEEVIKAQGPFLTAYAVCHDLAKTDTVSFEALVGSKGEAEGFMSRTELATEPVKTRYDKLRRAHEASASLQSFYDAYGIVVHYAEHARHGASDDRRREP